MPFSTARDKTELFTVVGAPCVAEQHNHGASHFPVDRENRERESGIAWLWVIFYVVIATVGLVSSGSVGKAIDYAVGWPFKAG